MIYDPAHSDKKENNNKMKIIGITGGIGSGKSLVAKLLEDKYNAYVINTDEIARKQMEPDGISYPGVVRYFGDEILQKDGKIDRVRLAQIVFADKDKLLKINELTHPLVLEEVQHKISEKRKEGTTDYFVIETALMIESGYDTACDEVWYVYAPEEDRRSRLKRDRNYTDDKIDAIFASQSKEEDFRRKFSKVVENDGSKENLEEQINRLIMSIQ
ncbi:dephospho-CoA kinase [Mobilitalea sibirica]|uniref:Dephospho-CoA kinase n=1 Tax=Mobilitalea sibirica TaxID=1462919 RepID=A0A8J7H7V5_9FIRM|nr:dephospho-CoA kinase [Mobilitalea sibirica]MBH1939755.1 dephospho-CoA kinase [Mobilitalea sibirica]